MSVLLVDDEETVLKTLEMVFSLFGYQARRALSGIEALELVERHSFDLIIMDVSMPGMSGLDVLQELRRRPATKTIPIVILSGEFESKSRAIEFGATAFVNKPFDLAEFRKTILTHATPRARKRASNLTGRS